MKTLPISTLALYLGAECEYEFFHIRDTRDRKWVKQEGEVDPDDLYKIQKPGKYRNFVLILRPLDSMTEEEWREAKRRFGLKASPSLIFSNDCPSDCRPHPLQMPLLVDYLRSKGFDLGGWIVIMVDGPEFIQPIYHTRWVPSLINSGLAKEATK